MVLVGSDMQRAAGATTAAEATRDARARAARVRRGRTDQIEDGDDRATAHGQKALLHTTRHAGWRDGARR